MKHDISSSVNAITKDITPAILVAVSKKQSADAIRTAASSGVCHIAENYIQEAIPKIEELKDLPLYWHFIGHIQSNKIALLAKYFDWVQTLHTKRHASLLEDACIKQRKNMQVLIQINITDEDTRQGAAIDDALALAVYISSLKHLNIRGIMAMYSHTSNSQALHKESQRVQSVFRQLLFEIPEIDTLSLGMSNDFQQALAAGANMLRLGRAIFGERYV